VVLQGWCWKFGSSMTWRWVKGRATYDFLKDRIATCTGSSGHDRTFVRLLNLEEEVAATLRNIVNYTPKDKALVCI
jgi:hypothetical protein